MITHAAALLEWSLAKWRPLPASSAAHSSGAGAAPSMGQAQKTVCEQPTSRGRAREYHIERLPYTVWTQGS